MTLIMEKLTEKEKFVWALKWWQLTNRTRRGNWGSMSLIIDLKRAGTPILILKIKSIPHLILTQPCLTLIILYSRSAEVPFICKIWLQTLRWKSQPMIKMPRLQPTKSLYLKRDTTTQCRAYTCRHYQIWFWSFLFRPSTILFSCWLGRKRHAWKRQWEWWAWQTFHIGSLGTSTTLW